MAAALLFLLGFAVAVAGGRWWFGGGPADRPDAGAVDEARLRDVAEAAARNDFAAVKALGDAAFRPGARVADAARLLAPYAVNSMPPFAVYALVTDNDDASTRRILLTLDGEGRVESFLAEEMAVIK